MIESPFVDSSFAVPVFSLGDDPIVCLNKAMAFLTAIASLRFPTTNNQLRTSSNLRNQATIPDGRITVQQVQGRQGQNYSDTTYKGNATSSKGNTTSGQERVVKCYNCQGYQNLFHLKKADKPTLYDGRVISAKHVAMPVIDDEETLILEEESRSKMSEKEKDPEAIKQNISHKPIDYEKLNRLSEDFGKRFTPQQECWLNKLSGCVCPILPVNLLMHPLSK
ncbi:hypothetical protein Tco_0333405 [Tanacetum coccineum]